MQASRGQKIAAWCCWKRSFLTLNLAQSLLLIDKDSPKEIMSTQNAKPEEKTSGSDMALVSLAVILALAGVCGFSFLSDQTLLVRLGVLIGGLVFAVVVAWFSPSGKRFIVYGRESYDELRRVVWPTRKETLNSTGMVIAFVVVVAVFLFLVDMIVEWGLYDVLLKLSL